MDFRWPHQPVDGLPQHGRVDGVEVEHPPVMCDHGWDAGLPAEPGLTALDADIQVAVQEVRAR